MECYSFTVTLPLSFAEAERQTRAALQEEHFGVISEIDIAAKLHEKIGVDLAPQKILGACNPQLAFSALQENPDVALALPCNVVLRQEGEQTVVSALLPSVALKPFAGVAVQKSSCTAEEALHRVFQRLGS